MHIVEVELIRFYVGNVWQNDYRSHSKVSCIIASLDVHRFERHVSYN